MCVSRAVLLYSPVCGVCIVSYCCLVRGVPNRPLHRFTDLIFTRVLLPKRGKGLFASPESHHHDLYKAASVGPVSVHRPLNSALSCPGNFTQDGKAQGKEMRIQHLKPFSFLRRNVTEDESSILCTTTQRREWSHWHWP